MSTVREILFGGFGIDRGCSNHDCIVRKVEGIGTNGSCGCLHNMSRGQLHILKSRLSCIIDKEVKDTE